jgi:hypothetical protein
LLATFKSLLIYICMQKSVSGLLRFIEAIANYLLSLTLLVRRIDWRERERNHTRRKSRNEKKMIRPNSTLKSIGCASLKLLHGNRRGIRKKLNLKYAILFCAR